MRDESSGLVPLRQGRSAVGIKVCEPPTCWMSWPRPRGYTSSSHSRRRAGVMDAGSLARLSCQGTSVLPLVNAMHSILLPCVAAIGEPLSEAVRRGTALVGAARRNMGTGCLGGFGRDGGRAPSPRPFIHSFVSRAETRGCKAGVRLATDRW